MTSTIRSLAEAELHTISPAFTAYVKLRSVYDTGVALSPSNMRLNTSESIFFSYMLPPSRYCFAVFLPFRTVGRFGYRE
jgi:hypothetical protein